MTLSLARRLLRGRVVPPVVVEEALVQACRGGASLLPALLRAEDGRYAAQIEAQFERADVPVIATVRVVPELFQLLPPGMAEGLLAVPVRRDVRLGTIDVAAVDPFDAHIQSEFAFHLHGSVRILRASYAAVRSALAALGGSSVSSGQHPRQELPVPLAPSNVLPTQDPSRGSEPPITVRGIPPAPNVAPTPSFVPGTTSGRHPSEPAIPLVRRSLPPAPPEKPKEVVQIEPLEAVRKAGSPSEVVQALCEAARVLGSEAVVFAVKSSGYWAQASSLQSIDLKSLQVPIQEVSVLSTASERGFYFGSLPDTPLHAGMRAVLGNSTQPEVYVVPIKVGQRCVLILLLAGFEHAYAVTRRADALAQAASQVLTDIVRTGR